MFNYSDAKGKDSVIYKINYTQVRLRLKAYCRDLKLSNADEEIEKHMDVLKAYANDGYIHSDGDLYETVNLLCKSLRSKSLKEGFEKSAAGRAQTLCWKCQNAVPKKAEDGRYIRGCRWSIARKPVDGWEAEQKTLECRTTYKVISCPKFKADHS